MTPRPDDIWPGETWQGFIGDSPDGGPQMRWWSINRLWHLSATLPVEEMPLNELEHVLNETPMQPQTKRELALLARRIWDADLQYPVILSAEGWLMDGSHRIIKAVALGLPTIKAVRFATNPEPDHIKTLAEMNSPSPSAEVGL